MTQRSGSSATVKAPLTDLENAVMRVVWDSGPCSVEAVYDVVSRHRDLKETTVRTLLRRLEQKGYLRHETEGRAYLYRATEPSRSLAARLASAFSAPGPSASGSAMQNSSPPYRHTTSDGRSDIGSTRPISRSTTSPA